MKTTTTALPDRRFTGMLAGSALGALLAFGIANPALARGDDPQAGQEEREGRHDARAKAQRARAEDLPAPQVRRNDSFAPDRPSERALQVREREDAQARTAERRMEHQRLQADREQQMRQASRERAVQERRATVQRAGEPRVHRLQEDAREQRERPLHAEHDRMQDVEQGRGHGEPRRLIEQRQRLSREHDERRSAAAGHGRDRGEAGDAQRRAREQQGVRGEQPAGFDERRRVERDHARREAAGDTRARLSEQERQRRIAIERERAEAHRREADARAAGERQRLQALQHDRRMRQYQYQQQYWQRQREMQRRWHSHRYDYWNDPYYYTPASYRYLRGGRYYEVNRYAADLLRQAVHLGYEQGYRAGEADRFDGWRDDYRNNLAYLDAYYGYHGRYVSPGEYRYYFREGFRRGYEDGYRRRYRYGRYHDGSYLILAPVLHAILDLQRY